MKILFMLLLTVISSNVLAVTTEDVLEQLMTFHGPNWPVLVKNRKDKLFVKGVLKSVIEREISLDKFGYQQEFQQDMWNNAVAQYGHFSKINTNGKLAPEDADFIQQVEDLVKGEDIYQQLAFYELLANSGSLLGAEKLNSIIKHLDDPATTYSAISNLMKIYEGESIDDRQEDLISDQKFRELASYNIKGPFLERIKNIKKWKKTITQSFQAIRLAKNKLKVENTELRDEYSKFSNELIAIGSFMGLKLSASYAPATDRKLNERSIASASEIHKNKVESKRLISSEKSQGVREGYWYLLALGIFMILGIFVWLRKSRR